MDVGYYFLFLVSRLAVEPYRAELGAELALVQSSVGKVACGQLLARGLENHFLFRNHLNQTVALVGKKFGTLSSLFSRSR